MKPSLFLCHNLTAESLGAIGETNDMKTRTLLLILMLLILPLSGMATSPYGDDVVEIVIEKGGQLENYIKKANALNTKKLSIVSPEKCSSNAVLNEKDFTFLSGMNQLEELYIDADIDRNKFNTHKFIQKNGKLSNTNFPNLKKFGFGDEASRHVQDLFLLKVQGLVIDGGKSYFPDNITFEDVYILSKPQATTSSNGFVDSKYNWIVKDVEYYRDQYDRLEEPYRQKIHAIHVGSRSWLESKICELLNPAVIYIHNGNRTEKYLANYNSNLYDEDKDLSKYDGILTAALTDTSFDTLRLPDGQEVISDSFFKNVSANLVDLNKIKKIDNNAFYGSHIKEIHIPATVQDINEKAFNNSELETVYMDSEFAPSIHTGYTNLDKRFGFENIQFIIPKGSQANYNLGEWKKLRVLEDGASTDYAFDVKEPGTLSSLMTDKIKQNVKSLKLRGILFSDDIKVLEECPNLISLDLGETFIAQSPKERREKQETSDYLAGIFMNMGVIAQAEYEHDRLSTVDNMNAQFLAKLGEMAKGQTIESDPNCQIPDLEKTHIQELILPLQLGTVNYKALPKNLKKITLPSDLKEFTATTETSLPEIVLPASVMTIKIPSSNLDYKNLRMIDLSACENPSILIEGKFHKLQTIKLPESYTSLRINLQNSLPVDVYFKGRELTGYFSTYKEDESTIYIPKGSRAGYSKIVNGNYKIIEQ